MKKLSKKQSDVIRILHQEKTSIILMKGISPHCFISKNLNYRISTSTLFALKDLKLVEEKIMESGRTSDEYVLTKLGVVHATGLALCKTLKGITIENKDCSNIVINPTDNIFVDRAYGLLPTVEVALKSVGRKNTGAELDQEYFKVASKRIDNISKNVSILEEMKFDLEKVKAKIVDDLDVSEKVNRVMYERHLAEESLLLKYIKKLENERNVV